MFLKYMLTLIQISFIFISICDACPSTCYYCRSSLQGSKVFRTIKDACFNGDEHPEFFTNFCPSYTNDCHTKLLFKIHGEEYNAVENFRDISADMALVQRGCVENDKNDIKIVKEKGFSVIEMHFVCGESNCNAINAQHFIYNNVDKMIPVCNNCEGKMNGECHKAGKVVVGKMKSSNFCNGVCYTHVIFKGDTPNRIVRGCMNNKYIFDDVSISKSITIGGTFVFPFKDDVSVINYCFAQNNQLCNDQLPSFDIENVKDKFRPARSYHQCIYCTSSRDHINKECINGDMNSQIFAKILCNEPCYTLATNWMILRGCIAAKVSLGGIYEYEKKIVNTLSAYAVKKNCFTKKKTYVCQEVCDGKSSPYCNHDPKVTVMKYEEYKYNETKSTKPIKKIRKLSQSLDYNLNGEFNEHFAFEKENSIFKNQELQESKLTYPYVLIMCGCVVMLLVVMYTSFTKRSKLTNNIENMSEVVSVYGR